MMNMEKINNETLENIVGGMAPLPFPRKKDSLFPSMLELGMAPLPFPRKKDPLFLSMPELGMAPLPFPKKKLMAPTPVIRP